jgi:hypothetical protein
LVDITSFHLPHETIEERLQLIIPCDFLAPNFMKPFQWSLDTKVMLMKEPCLTLLQHTFEKGQHVSKGVLSKFKLGSFS